MRIRYLIIFLICGMFVQRSWAPPPGKGATAAPDISKCNLDSSQEKKLKVKDKDGKINFVCMGKLICEGKAIPISCRVNEHESCPIAKECKRLKLDDPLFSVPIKLVIENPIGIWTSEQIKKAKPIPIPIIKGEPTKIILKQFTNKILADPANINDFKGGAALPGLAISVTKELFKENSFFHPSGKILSFVEVGDTKSPSFCSGSVTKIGRKMFIVTAAHCLVKKEYSGSPGDFSKWLNDSIYFTSGEGYPHPPGRNTGRYVKNIILLQGYLPWNLPNENRRDYDLALIELEDLPYETVDCCYGLMTANFTPPGIVLGYPKEPPFPTEQDIMFYLKIIRFLDKNSIIDDMTGGASGGPWIGHFGVTGKYGYISGVTAYRLPEDQPNIRRSPLYWHLIEDLVKCSKKEIPCEEIPVR